MIKEVKRNTWSKFFKTFSSKNQHRSINVNVQDKKNQQTEIVGNFSLMGLALEKKGRLIDGIKLYAGWADPELVTQPIISFKNPSEVFLEKGNDGTDTRLKVKTKDGTEAVIDLNEGGKPEQGRRLVERIAYSLYERRGRSNGNDMGDWLEAENRVRRAEEMFV